MTVRALMEKLEAGEVTVDEVIEQLRQSPPYGFATVLRGMRDGYRAHTFDFS
jgi:hypothetical protein